MSEIKDTYLTDLFINEAKPALKRHSGSGGGGSPSIPIKITQNGTYDASDFKTLKFGKSVTLKNKIDIDGLMEALRRAAIIPIEDGYITNLFSAYGSSSDVAYLEQDIMSSNYDDCPITLRFEYYVENDDDNYSKSYLYFTREYLERFEMSDEEEGWYEFDWDEEVPINKVSDLQLMIPIPYEYNSDNCRPPEATYYLEEFVFTEPATINAEVDTIHVDIPDALNYLLERKTEADYFFSHYKSFTIPDGYIKPEATRNITSMSNMFSYSSVRYVPLFDTSNVTDMYGMFYSCTELRTVPLFNTSRVRDTARMFYNCQKLESVPPLDMRSSETSSDMFGIARSLTNCSLKNIKNSLQVGSGTSWGHLLTVESLIHLIYQLIDIDRLQTLTVGSANLTKLANVYVRTIDITDEMRAEDDLINEKLPFEVCNSTDEGAVLITDYAKFKNWQIA